MPAGTQQFSSRGRSFSRFINASPSPQGRALGAFESCDLVWPLKNLPVISNILETLGCSPAGKAAIATGLATIPTAGPMISLFGTPFIIGCICQGQPTTPKLPPQPPPSTLGSFSSPAMLAGIAALGIGAALFVRSRQPKRTAAPAAPAAPRQVPKATPAAKPAAATATR